MNPKGKEELLPLLHPETSILYGLNFSFLEAKMFSFRPSLSSLSSLVSLSSLSHSTASHPASVSFLARPSTLLSFSSTSTSSSTFASLTLLQYRYFSCHIHKSRQTSFCTYSLLCNLAPVPLSSHFSSSSIRFSTNGDKGSVRETVMKHVKKAEKYIQNEEFAKAEEVLNSKGREEDG